MNHLAEGDSSHTEAQSGSSSRSSAIDKGAHAGGGGGVLGAQGNLDLANSKQTGLSTATSQTGQREDERHKGQYTAMTLFLWPDYLELSSMCKAFFLDPHLVYPSPALEKFLEEFGTSFHRTADLGVTRESIIASRQGNTSETASEDRARQLALEGSGDGPNVNLGLGVHHNVASSTGDASAASVGNIGKGRYSHGGAANLAHVDDAAWRASLLDPSTWVLLRDGQRDVQSVLQIVNNIAERMVRTSYDYDAGRIASRSSSLLEHIQMLEGQEHQRRLADALEASRRTIRVQMSLLQKAITVSVPSDNIIASTEVMLSGKGNSTERLSTPDNPNNVSSGQRELRSRAFYSKGRVVARVTCNISSDWSAQRATLAGGLPYASHSVSVNEVRLDFGTISAQMGGSEVSKSYPRSASCTAVPPRCFIEVTLERDSPAATCDIEVMRSSPTMRRIT